MKEKLFWILLTFVDIIGVIWMINTITKEEFISLALTLGLLWSLRETTKDLEFDIHSYNGIIGFPINWRPSKDEEEEE